jgi:hypothetical protein
VARSVAAPDLSPSTEFMGPADKPRDDGGVEGRRAARAYAQ